MKHLFAIFFCIVSARTMAQLPDYYVDLITGTATITRPGGKPVAAKQKQLVYKNDRVTIAKGAELTLVDRDGGYFVLNAGSNLAGELVRKSAKKTKDGITTEYIKFVFNELVNPGRDFDKFKKENIGQVSGAVSRGQDHNNRILPIDGYKTSAGTINFRWHKTSPSSNYVFELFDQENKNIIRSAVKDTQLALQVSEALHGVRGIYKWRVTSEDGNNEDEMPVYFEVMTPDTEKKLTSELLAPLSNENLEKQLQQVEKLEKNGFIDAASAHYAGLVKNNQSNKALMKSYVAFLLRYGFDDQAKAAWQL